MMWNWQQLDWPKVSWDRDRLSRAVAVFLVASGVLARAMKHLNERDREQLTIDAFCTEALTTSEVEGEILDRASVHSSIRKKLGLAADMARAGPAEPGIAEMVVDLYRSYVQRISHVTLFRWHGMLLQGRENLTDVGRYRSGDEAMQVVYGRVHLPRVHFEPPLTSALPEQMVQSIDWSNRTSPDRADSLPRPDPGCDRASILRVHSSVRRW